MKKIVSTMFKCGAICASLTTAFADKDSEEANMEAVRELKKMPMVTPEDRETVKQKVMESDLYGLLEKNAPKVLLLLSLDEKNGQRFEEEANCYPKEAGKILSKSLRNEIQLPPEAMEILEKWQRDGLLKELEIAANGVTPKDRREALARAMEVYSFDTPKAKVVSREVPELHNKTLVLNALDSENKARFYELINRCRSCWKIALEVFDKYSNGEIKLSSKAVKIISECLLEIVANGVTPKDRREAQMRLEVIEKQTFLQKENPELFFQAQMMSFLDKQWKKQFCRCASREPELAIKILDACDKSEIKISPESREILENWEYNFVVFPIRIAAYGETIKEREEAREMLTSFHEKWQLKPEEARLWHMLALVHALDTGNKDRFYQIANQIKETEPETVDEFLFVSRRMKFHKEAKKILRDFEQ